jgi:Glycosyltransferase family 87
MSRRLILIVMVVLYMAFGLLGVIFLAPNTFVGADHATYQRASDALWQHGDPYFGSLGYGYNFQYRYPPLLAMVWPILGWAPLWWALLGLSTAYVFYLWYRDAGWFGLLPIFMLAGAWGQPLINGNAQPILMALLAMVPYYRRAGAVALALGTMLKLHPVLGVVWYAGRRDWRALGWYAGAMAILTLIQAPWLGQFIRYYTTNPDSSPTAYEGFGLRLFGTVPWLVVTAILAIVAYWSANGRLGWFANLVFQLVALPRLIPTNLALLLSSPFRSRKQTSVDVGQARPSVASNASEAHDIAPVWSVKAGTDLRR